MLSNEILHFWGFILSPRKNRNVAKIMNQSNIYYSSLLLDKVVLRQAAFGFAFTKSFFFLLIFWFYHSTKPHCYHSTNGRHDWASLALIYNVFRHYSNFHEVCCGLEDDCFHSRKEKKEKNFIFLEECTFGRGRRPAWRENGAHWLVMTSRWPNQCCILHR